MVVGSCANIRDINWLGDDISGIETCDLIVSKVNLSRKRANQLMVDVLDSILLDGGVGSAGYVVFSKELANS